MSTFQQLIQIPGSRPQVHGDPFLERLAVIHMNPNPQVLENAKDTSHDILHTNPQQGHRPS